MTEHVCSLPDITSCVATVVATSVAHIHICGAQYNQVLLLLLGKWCYRKSQMRITFFSAITSLSKALCHNLSV